jgi:hypothetical protein
MMKLKMFPLEIDMKTRWLVLLVAAASLALLGGCATTPPRIRSDVTVFQQWPGGLQGAPITFARTDAQNNDLEYRTYENLVAAELHRLGFTDAGPGHQARIKVAIGYGISGRDVHLVQPVVVDPFWPHYGYWPYYSRWRRYPFYDPFWYGPPMVAYEESQFEVFQRRLKILLSDAETNRTVYDVTVNSQGTNGNLAKVMPYMVHAAFAEFPSKNGETRHVVLEMQDQAPPAGQPATATPAPATSSTPPTQK